MEDHRNDVNLISSQGLRHIQNGGTEKTLEHAAKILHVFCHVTHQDTLNFLPLLHFSDMETAKCAVTWSIAATSNSVLSIDDSMIILEHFMTCADHSVLGEIN